MAPVSQRLVPIRPSPLKGISPQSNNVISNINSSSASIMKTGAKRKLADDMANQVRNKKHSAGGGGVTGNKSTTQSSSMGRRNARERNRVKQVNNSFTTLRQHIPGAAKSKKVSKVETLKQAVDYIRNLQQLLEEHDSMMCSDSQNECINNVNVVTSTSVCSQAGNMTPIRSTNTQQLQQQLSPVQIHQQHSPIQIQRQVCSRSQGTPALSNSNNNSFTNYYFSENISPVSPTTYPMNVMNHQNNRQEIILKSETDCNFSNSTTVINQQMTPSYTSNCQTPLNQITFTLPPLQSSPYSTSTTIYPSTITYSPNSIAEPSPTSAYSPNSIPISPTHSPSNVSTSVPEYAATYPTMLEDVKPSLMETQNFTLPSLDSQFGITNEITTIDIERVSQAIATTKEDLDLLDAIAMWQEC